MNLQFENVRTVEINGIIFTWQRADVTDCREFWFFYKNAQNKDSIKDKLIIQREIKFGKKCFFAYRLIPKNSLIPIPSINHKPYFLKSTDKLLPYQAQVVENLCRSLVINQAAADGSDTGLGKTYTALACARELLLTPAIVCTKAGIAGWKRACGFMDTPPLFITNWENAKSGKFPFASRKKDEYGPGYEFTWKLPANTLLIFDEAHYGNHTGSINNALYIAARNTLSLSLSATFADMPERLRALFYVVKALTMEQFDAYLKSQIPLQFDEKLNSLDSIGDMKFFNRILYPNFGFRLSYEHPDVKKFFPDAVHTVDVITIPKMKVLRQNALYQKLVEMALHYRNLGNSAELLVADLRYRQEAEILKADTVAEIAAQYIYEGKSVCIFVNFIETLNYLANKLKTRSLIYGNQEADGIYRERVRADFQKNQSRIIICMSKAGGQSIDLHDISGQHQRISLIFPTYEAIVLKQVLGRTRRAGSRSVPVMKLVYAGGTIEEKVADRVLAKVRNISALNDGDLTEPDLFTLRTKERRSNDNSDDNSDD